MDDFFTDLENALAFIDQDCVWKRKVGNIEIWFAPTPYDGQMKVNEVYGNSELGVNMVLESKRVTLSHSIVGINETDLRPHRHSFAFSKKERDGKTVKCSLDAYLYDKISSWPAQFVDDAFEVFADLIDTYQKKNLLEVKFENRQTPRELLADLESKVADLRQELGLPPLVVMRESSEDTEPMDSETLRVQSELEEVRPFDRVITPSSGPNESTLPPPSVDPTPVSPPLQKPVLSLEEQLGAEVHFANNRSSNGGPVQVSPSGSSSTDAPYRPHQVGVVAEKRAEKSEAIPKFDQVVPPGNINPRFARPVR